MSVINRLHSSVISQVLCQRWSPNLKIEDVIMRCLHRGLWQMTVEQRNEISPVAVWLHPPWFSHEIAWVWTWGSAVRSLHIATWATVWRQLGNIEYLKILREQIQFLMKWMHWYLYIHVNWTLALVRIPLQTVIGKFFHLWKVPLQVISPHFVPFDPHFMKLSIFLNVLLTLVLHFIQNVGLLVG
jgi:hypothetical protein